MSKKTLHTVALAITTVLASVGLVWSLIAYGQ